MQLLNALHDSVVHSRRVDSLTKGLIPMLPEAGSVLDVGCGDGWLASLLAEQLPLSQFCGIDVLVRPDTHISIAHFDGVEIPYPDHHFDTVMMVDVLHHTGDPAILLREAKRVARNFVVLKDHTRDGLAARATLRMMDWIGNAHHGVALPYNYLSHSEWRQLFDSLDLTIDQWNAKPRLYGAPVDWFCGRSLHFLARLTVGNN